MICPHCKQTVHRKFGEVVPACIDCGELLPNGRMRFCQTCRLERRRQTYRESHRRRYYANPRKFIAATRAWQIKRKLELAHDKEKSA